MYKLDTNEGVFFVTDNPRKYMFDYIKNKRALGYRLCEIIYCWAPIYVSKYYKGPAQ